MIKKIKWSTILKIWQNDLWPDRSSPTEPTSAMVYLGGHDIGNMNFKPSFFGYYVGGQLVGVNSGHLCVDNSYRSRGLWVDFEHRKKGYAQDLLRITVEQGIKEKAEFVWSYPRKSSWKTYEAVEFKLESSWERSDTSEANAFCYLKLN